MQFIGYDCFSRNNIQMTIIPHCPQYVTRGSMAIRTFYATACSGWNKQGKSEGFDSCDRLSNLTQIGFKSPIFHLGYLEIWWMSPKNNRARLLYYIKLCVSFQIHQFDEWPWKAIGHLFYATSSFVHHSVAIGEFKLELQSGNAQFGSNSTIFRAV